MDPVQLVVLQERMLGFAMGGVVGMGVFVYEQRQIWKSTAGLAETLSGGILPPSRGVPVCKIAIHCALIITGYCVDFVISRLGLNSF